MPPQHGLRIDGFRKIRLHGNARDFDPVRWKPERLHVNFVVLLRHEIPVERPRDPKRMEVKIRHDHAETRVEFSI